MDSPHNEAREVPPNAECPPQAGASALELAQFACNQFAAPCAPEDLINSYEELRVNVQEGKINASGRSPRCAVGLERAVGGKLDAHISDIQRLTGIKTVSTESTVRTMVRLSLREAALKYDDAPNSKRLFNNAVAEKVDSDECFGRTVLLLGEMAMIQGHTLRNLEMLILNSSGPRIASLLQKRACSLSVSARRELIDHCFNNPEGAIRQAEDRLKIIERDCRRLGVTLSISELTQAAVTRKDPETVVPQVLKLTEAYEGDRYVSASFAQRACTFTSQPRDYLETFRKRADRALELKEQGAFPELNDKQIIRLSFHKPKVCEARMAKFTQGRTASSSSPPPKNQAVYEQALQALETLNDTHNLGLSTSILKHFARIQKQFTPEELAYMGKAEVIRRRLAAHSDKIKPPPSWLSRMVVQAYPQNPTHECVMITGNISILLQSGILHTATLDRPPEAHQAFDSLTCHYPVFADSLLSALEPLERKAILSLYGIGVIFGYTDTADLEAVYGPEWKHTTEHRLLPKAFNHVAECSGRSLPAPLRPLWYTGRTNRLVVDKNEPINLIEMEAPPAERVWRHVRELVTGLELDDRPEILQGLTSHFSITKQELGAHIRDPEFLAVLRQLQKAYNRFAARASAGQDLAHYMLSATLGTDQAPPMPFYRIVEVLLPQFAERHQQHTPEGLHTQFAARMGKFAAFTTEHKPLPKQKKAPKKRPKPVAAPAASKQLQRSVKQSAPRRAPAVTEASEILTESPIREMAVADLDLLNIYLRQMRQYPRLKPVEAKEAVKTVQAGRAAREQLAAGEYGNDDHKAELQAMDRRGARAKEELINSNLPLVVSIAKRYMYKGLPLADLIQEGNMGLVSAVEKYVPTEKSAFSTYAYVCVRGSILSALTNKSRVIRLTQNAYEDLSAYKYALSELRDELQRDPTNEEIAAHMEITTEKAATLHRLNAPIASINAPIGEDGEGEFQDLLADTNSEAAFDDLFAAISRQEILKLLQALPGKEAEVLILYFGLEEAPQTLADIGETLHFSRQRVSSIKDRALARLRSPELREQVQEAFGIF